MRDLWFAITYGLAWAFLRVWPLIAIGLGLAVVRVAFWGWFGI